MAKKQLTRKLTNVAEKEAALEALEQKRVSLAQQPVVQTPPSVLKPEKVIREVHRFNIELPMDLYTEVKAHIDHTGQTLKGFLCLTAREYLQNIKK